MGVGPPVRSAHEHLMYAPGEPWEFGTRDTGAYATISDVVDYFEWLGSNSTEDTVMSDNHLGRCRQPPWPVGLDGRRACPSGGQPHRPD
jgi:hypothetical protein